MVPIIDCDESKLMWNALDAHISAQWALEGRGREWDRISWISNSYLGWEPLWTAAGAIPSEIEDRVGKVDPGTHGRLIGVANQCAQLAIKIWETRNKCNEEWIDSIPSLRERKREAGINQWKFKRDGEDEPQKRERVKTRLNKRKAERELHKMSAVTEAKEKHTRNVTDRNKKARLENRLGVSDEVAQIEERQIIQEAKRKVNEQHSRGIKLASYAGKTPDINTGGVETVESMHDTLPATTTSNINLTRGPGTFHRVPNLNSDVIVFWAEKEGVKHNNLKGQWVPGRITSLEWPEGEAMPGVGVTYLDGSSDFNSMNRCGDTIVLVTEPKGKDGIKYTEVFPKKVTEWLGRGSRLQVKFRQAWCVGEVVGRNDKGILVKYSDGICTHKDLHKRGCRIREFRRHVEEEKQYETDPYMKCPYLEEDEECECVVCRRRKWPSRYKAWGLTEEQTTEMEATKPAERLAKKRQDKESEDHTRCPMKKREPHVGTKDLSTEDQGREQPRGLRRTRNQGAEGAKGVRQNVEGTPTVDEGEGSDSDSDREGDDRNTTQCPVKKRKQHIEIMDWRTENRAGERPRGTRRTRDHGVEGPRRRRQRAEETKTVDGGDESDRNSDKEGDDKDDDQDEKDDGVDQGEHHSNVTGTGIGTQTTETGNRTSLRRPRTGPSTGAPARNTTKTTAGADAAGTESRGPRRGPVVPVRDYQDAPGDYNEEEFKRNEARAEKTKRRHLRKRTRESGTQGGAKGEADGSGQEEDPG